MDKQELLKKLREKYFWAINEKTDNDLLEIVKQDYNDLIILRNKLHDNNTIEVIEEDHITCDHILDYMEEFMKILGIGE